MYIKKNDTGLVRSLNKRLVRLPLCGIESVHRTERTGKGYYTLDAVLLKASFHSYPVAHKSFLMEAELYVEQ